MSSRAAVAIYGTALATDEGSFTMEDVLFTGVLREKAGIATPTVDGDLCHHYMGNSSFKHVAKELHNQEQ